MVQTFEERLGPAIDELYRASVFLTGGEGAEAESLLMRAVRGAFKARSDVDRGGPEGLPFPSWMTTRLIRTFLERGDSSRSAEPRYGPPPPPPGAPDAPAAPSFPDDLALPPSSVKSLLAEVRSVPPEARAALWLVVARRWSYGAAADALAVSDERLQELLAYRRALGEAVARDGGSEGERRTEGNA